LIVDQKSGRIFPVANLDALRLAVLDVTTPGRIEQYKQESKLGLASWREKVSPVSEIRRALKCAGALSGSTFVA
jgi:hypothetical protein